MKLKLLVIFATMLVFVVSVTVGIYYALDMTRQKLFWEKHLTQLLQRPVHIKRARLQILPQAHLILDTVQIEELDGHSEFISIDRLNLGISLRPLLSRVLLFDYVVLERPRISLRRDDQRTFNCSDLVLRLHERIAGLEEQNNLDLRNFRTLLETVVVRKGEIELKDHASPNAPFVLSISQLDFQAGTFSARAPTPFRLKCRVVCENKSSSLHVKGKIGPLTGNLSLAELKLQGALEVETFPLALINHYLESRGTFVPSGGVVTGKCSYQGILGGDFEGSARIEAIDLKLDNPANYEKPLMVRKAILEFSLTRQGKTLNLDKIRLALPEMNATGSLLIHEQPEKKMRATLKTRQFQYSSVLPYLPLPLFPENLNSLLRNVITQGTIEKLSLVFSRSFGENSPAFTDAWLKGLDGVILFRDASIKAFPDNPPIEKVAGEVHLRKGEVTLNNVTGIYGRTEIERGAVSVSQEGFLDLSTDIKLDLNDAFDLTKARWLPSNVRRHFDDLKGLSGESHLTVNASGPLSDVAAVTFSGRMDLIDVTIDYLPFRKIGNNVGGTLLFTPTEISLQDLTGFWADAPFRCKGAIKSYRSRDSLISVQITSKGAPIGDLASAFLRQDIVGGNGTVDISVDLECPGYRSKDLSYKGQAALSGLSLQVRGFPKPFDEVRGTIGFSSQAVTFSNLHLSCGSSRVSLNGLRSNGDVPIFTGKIEGEFVDLQDFFTSESTEQEKPRPNFILDNVPCHIQTCRYGNFTFEDVNTAVNFRNGVTHFPSIEIKSGRYGAVDFTTVDTRQDSRDTTVTIQDGVIAIPSLKLESKGGYWSGKNIVWPLGPQVEGQLLLNTEVMNIPVENLFAHLSPEKRKLTGTLNAACVLSATGLNMDERLKRLGGELNFTIKDGVLRKATVLSKLFSLLNVSRVFRQDYSKLFIEGISYTTIDGSFTIQDGVARTENLSFDSPSVRMHAIGQVDLRDTTFDVEIAVEPLETVDKILNKIPLIGTILMGEEGSLVVYYYKITGPYENPRIQAMPLTSLGRKAQGIFERIFKLPGKLLKTGTKSFSQ